MQHTLYTFADHGAIHSYGVCIATGIALAVILLWWDPHRRQICDDDALFSLLPLAGVSALLAGRALFLLEHGITGMSWCEMCTPFDGGLCIIGAVAGACISLALLSWWYKYDIWHLAGTCAIYAPLAHAWGRLGCFYGGCCFGRPTSLPIGIVYPSWYTWIPHIPLHPTQLYSAFAHCCAFTLLFWMRKRWSVSGATLVAGYLASLAANRFFIGFLRWNTSNNTPLLYTWGGLSMSQTLSLCVFGGILITVVWKTVRARMQ